MIVRRLLRTTAALVLAGVTIAAARASSPDEARTAAYFTSIRHQPSALLAVLAAMPKGGDLHNHLSGAVYAESYLRWAADDATPHRFRDRRHGSGARVVRALGPAQQAEPRVGVKD